MNLIKYIVARFPNTWQSELRRIHYRRQIKNDTFITGEPEFKVLQDLIFPGDWVVDIGANVGYYTKRFF